jgi:hypothetical protein
MNVAQKSSGSRDRPKRAVARSHQAGIDFNAISAGAIRSLPAVLKRVLPGGRVVGREYIALNPTRTDRRPGSFKVRIVGPRAGCWSDFATGDRGGDVISLVAYVERIGQGQAATLVARMLGINLMGEHHG